MGYCVFLVVCYLFSSFAYKSRNFPLNRRIKAYSNSRLFLKVALTRELGSNYKLKEILEEKNIDCVEVPCIAFGPGKDINQLNSAMKSTDVIVISSPQAAAVFLTSWKENGKPNVKVATVGKGTSKPIIAEGITPFFEPSDSTAATLSLELPHTHGINVLYPTSTIAENTMQNGLEKRGFVVTRLNTYETIEATWNAEMLADAKDCEIVTFASPSAVKTWASRCGYSFLAVTIGPTSAKAATGFKQVVSPTDSKGLEAWADLIIQTVDEYDSGVC